MSDLNTVELFDEIARRGIGGNNPPPPTLEEQLAEAAADLIAARDEKFTEPMRIWRARPILENDEQEELATKFIAAAKGLSGKFDALRVEKKRPFDDAAKTVQMFFKNAAAPLDHAEQHVRGLLDTYKAKKLAQARADQAAAAEAARKAAAEAQTPEDMERAAHLATVAAEPVEPIRAHTDSGAMSSMRTDWLIEVTDLEAVPRQFMSCDQNKVKAWLKGLPKGTVPQQPGLKFTETVKSIVRKG